MKNLTRYRIIELMELLSGSVLPIIFWISLIFGFDSPYIAILTIISAVLHEIGHSMAISLLSKSEVTIKGHATGFRIKRSGMMTYKNEIAVLLSGPAVNIAIFILSLPLGNVLSGYARILGYINLATGVSNLLPFEGYDGYGIIKKLLELTGTTALIKPLFYISFILTTAVTFLALYLLLKFGVGYWVFGVFFTILLSKIWRLTKEDILRE